MNETLCPSDKKFYRGYLEEELLIGGGGVLSHVSHHVTLEMFQEQASLAEAGSLHTMLIKYRPERGVWVLGWAVKNH